MLLGFKNKVARDPASHSEAFYVNFVYKMSFLLLVIEPNLLSYNFIPNGAV